MKRNQDESFSLKRSTLRIVLGAAVALFVSAAGAQVLPIGGTVAPGNGSAEIINTSSAAMTIKQSSARAIIDWNTFNVSNDATVTFSQFLGSSSVTVNRVGASAGPSAIDGTLNANGHVMILNPNGVMFGSSASVNVAGLIASTGHINEEDSAFMAGGDFSITGATTGEISNQGRITGDRVAFIAPTISNSGTITAPGGRISLASANAATVTLKDGLYEVAVTQAAASGSIANTGELNATGGGTIALNEANLLSSTINLEGIQRANTIVVHGDQVVLASDLDAPTVSGDSKTVNVHSGAQIQDGVDIARSGAAVNVAAGTYAESLTIGKALTLSGAGAGKSIIDPVSGNGISIGGNIDAMGSVRIDGFTFQNAPVAGIDVASNTVLDVLTVENSDFTGNAGFGFRVSGNSNGGVPGLNRVELLDSTFHANGRNYTDPAITSLGYGDISINYYNGDATLRNLAITGYASGGGAHQGIQLRGKNAIDDAGTVVFDNVSITGSYRRPEGSHGTWNPGGPGTALHILGYKSVANISFNDVVLAPTVGHGLFAEGLSTPLNIGNTVFGAPDTAITGGGAFPTRSWNILTGTNDQNNVLTNIDATGASFTGAADGFAIEDRVFHAMDSTAVGLVTWKKGNLYVTPDSGGIQRGMDLAGAGDTVNVGAGTYAEDVDVTAPRNLVFNGSTVHSLTVDGSGAGIGGSVTADGASGFTFNAPTTLLSDTTLTTLGSDITLNADVQGSARGLGLIAGSGNNRGDVFVTSGGTQSDPLGAFNVVARNYELQGTLWVDRYSIDATGNVALSDHTLRALGSGVTNTINAVGNITGSTISNGSSQVVGKGNVTANVTAAGAAVVSGNNVQGNISAGSAVVSGNNVQGNISANSVTVSAQQNVQVHLNTQTAVVHAGGSASLSGSASNVTIRSTKGGSMNGDFGQVSNVGDGVVAVNGKPRVNDSLADSGYNHRALPVETAVGGEPATVRSATSASFVPFAGPNVQLSRVGPGDVLESIDQGRSVEIDLSPRNEPERQKK